MSHPGSIVAAFLAHTERDPGAACLAFEGRLWSRADLLAEALGWASGYAELGVAAGDRVALMLENSPTFVTALLGAHMAGATVVAVNTQYRQVELRHILADAGVRLVVADAARRDEIVRVRADLPALERLVVVDAPPGPDEIAAGEMLGAARPLTPRRPDPNAVALIGYTSGTTGLAKGAMLLHRNLAANAQAVTTAWGWTDADRLLLTLPLFHAHGLCVGLHGTLLRGARADLRRKFDAPDVLDALIAEGGRPGSAGAPITMFFGVPTMYTRLIAEVERRGQRPPPIRLYVSGSAPLAVQTFEQFERLFGQPILERYGMTETIMNMTNPLEGERRPGTVGRPFPGQEARIVDVVSRSPLDDQTTGEIQVRGEHVFAGYWQNEAATREAFDAEGWFNTGDLGWRSADGYYTISGRARELIISGGFNIYPREVEEVLLTHPAVGEVAVLGMPDPEFGEQVVAVVVPAPRQSVDPEALVAHCRDQLASYKKPRRVVFIESLPRNALGKVQKHVLRQAIESSAPLERITPGA